MSFQSYVVSLCSPGELYPEFTKSSTHHTSMKSTTASTMLCSTAPVPGSSSQEYNLAFEIPPPSSVRPGSQFTIPVVVSVRPASNQRPNPVQQLAVHASLRNENHAPATGLIGPLTSSVRSRSGNTTAGYASFNPLRITQPGRYRLRVMLAAASYSGVMTKEYVDSGVIHVDPGAEAEQRPIPAQVARLQRLMAEDIDISSADIAAWQNAK